MYYQIEAMVRLIGSKGKYIKTVYHSDDNDVQQHMKHLEEQGFEVSAVTAEPYRGVLIDLDDVLGILKSQARIT